jgi:hypothetical protein
LFVGKAGKHLSEFVRQYTFIGDHIGDYNLSFLKLVAYFPVLKYILKDSGSPMEIVKRERTKEGHFIKEKHHVNYANWTRYRYRIASSPFLFMLFPINTPLY